MSPGTHIDRNLDNNKLGTHADDEALEPRESIDQRAEDILDQFIAARQQAMDALKIGQAHQKFAYDKGRRDIEFEEDDLVLINPHSLELLRKEKGKGMKLLTRYEGPFKILRKLSPTTYQLKLPTSYGIHLVINIKHLVKYTSSPPEFGERVIKESTRESFEELPEVEIERIIDERMRKTQGNGRRQREFKVRFVGYDETHDEWLTKKKLRNAPDILNEWLERSSNEVTRDQITLPLEKRGRIQKSQEFLVDSNVRQGSRIKKIPAKLRR